MEQFEQLYPGGEGFCHDQLVFFGLHRRTLAVARRALLLNDTSEGLRLPAASIHADATN